jgi:acyl dehydratase
MTPATLTLDACRALVGQEIGVSTWFTIDQARIDAFAAATGDHQFIHVDPERARAETPFGGTIAHGLLTLSMLSAMVYDAVPGIEGERMGINYGFDAVRFVAPVRAGRRIRARFVLEALTERQPGQWLRTTGVTVEIDGEPRPALVARWLGLSVLG